MRKIDKPAYGNYSGVENETVLEYKQPKIKTYANINDIFRAGYDGTTAQAAKSGGIEATIAYIYAQRPASVEAFIETNKAYAKSGNAIDDVLDIMEAKGDKAIKEVFEMHPDKEAFIDAYGMGGNCMICANKRKFRHPAFKLIIGLLILGLIFFLIFKYYGDGE